MVMKMNKTMFLKKLQEKTNLSEKDTLVVSEVLDEYFVFGKKNKDKIVSAIKEKLNITDTQADEIYNIAMSIITSNVKEKLKHPFRSQD
jgi:nucleoid DNA-binding protein